MRNWKKKLVREWEEKSSLCDMWRRKWCAQIHFCCAVVSIYIFPSAPNMRVGAWEKEKKRDAPWAPSRCLLALTHIFVGQRWPHRSAFQSLSSAFQPGHKNLFAAAACAQERNKKNDHERTFILQTPIIFIILSLSVTRTCCVYIMELEIFSLSG